MNDHDEIVALLHTHAVDHGHDDLVVVHTHVVAQAILDHGYRRQRPTAPRPPLAEALRNHRLAAGRTQRDVADALDWSVSKILRIEHGTTARVNLTDLRALLAHYHITDPAEIDRLVALVRDSRPPQPPGADTP